MTVDDDEELLQLLYLLPVGIVRFDAGGAVTRLNPLTVKLMAPVVGHDALEDAHALLDPVLPDLAARLATADPAAETSGPVVSGRRALGDVADGAAVVEAHVHRLPDGFVAILVDVTAQAEAQRRLRIEEARYEAIVKSVQGYGICSIDTEGRVNTWNESAARLFRVDDGLGRSLDELVPLGAPCTTILRAAAAHGWQKVTSRIDADDGGRWLETLVSRIDDDEVAPGFVVVSRDRTDEHRHEQRLRRAAFTDPLTGLVNRRGFARHHDRLRRRSDAPHAVLMVDLDHFKAVNDTYGHDAGDAVLVAVADTIAKAIRRGDLPARLGGEEFAVFLPGASAERALDVAERLRTAIEALEVHVSDDVTLHVTASIGVCTDALPLDDALGAADDALYEAKNAGRNCVVQA